MNSEVMSITEKMLHFSTPTRAYLAEILLESLDYEEDFPVSKEWLNEIRRRCEEIDKGKVQLIPGETVLKYIGEKYL